MPSRPATTSHAARAPSGSSTHTGCSSEAWKNATQMSCNASCLLLPRDASLDSTSFRAHTGEVPAWCSGARQSANCLPTIPDRTVLSSFRWRQRKVQLDCGEVDTMGSLQVLSSGESRRISNGKEASDVSHSASGQVTTSHEFVVNGWIKALVSAEPFCRLETSTSNRQPNGHDHGKVPEPTARAEVWSEVFLPASLTPPAEKECTGAFRSFGPNCCLVRSVGQDLAAATQGGRTSKGWTQDRFSSRMGRARETALAALRRPCGLHRPFLGKRHRRETPRQSYTTTTAHRRNHWNSFMLSLFTAQCTSVASRVHMCAVSD